MIFERIKSRELLETLTIFRRSLIFQTKEFFQNSTLHGVRYIAESGRPIGEKFMWFCFTSIGAVTALVIIMSLWEKFQTNPTITGLDTDFHNQNVVFPTVIVCPDAAADIENAANVAYKDIADYDQKNGDILAPFVEKLTTLTFENMDELYKIRLAAKDITPDRFNKKTLRELALAANISCENVLTNCKYRDETINCCVEFEPVYTEHGFCYAFNSRFKSTDNADEKTGSPHDLYETDKKWALAFSPNSSARVFIFSNEEYFGNDFSAQIELEDGQVAEARISKKNTYTTDDARQLTIGQRKCIFFDEVKLKYFPEDYTFSSCMKECRMKKALKICKCNPPFYKPISSLRMCNVDDFPCLYKHRTNITNIRDCLHCELSCSKTIFNIEKLSKAVREPDSTAPSVSVEFLTWPIIRYKREVLFGWVDLLVSFGGIASLFLGFSLLSGVEIIYYFTLRACCMVYRNRQELYEIEERIKHEPPPPIDLSFKLGNKSHFQAKFVDDESDPNIRNNLNNEYKTEKPSNLLLNVPADESNEYGRRRRTGKDYFNYAKFMYKSPRVIPQYTEKDSWQYGPYLP